MRYTTEENIELAVTKHKWQWVELHGKPVLIPPLDSEMSNWAALYDEDGVPHWIPNYIDQEVEKMKVYKMNDYDWVAAQTSMEAIKWYSERLDLDETDVEEDFQGLVDGDKVFVYFYQGEYPLHESYKRFKLVELYKDEWFYQVPANHIIKTSKIYKPMLICTNDY